MKFFLFVIIEGVLIWWLGRGGGVRGCFMFRCFGFFFLCLNVDNFVEVVGGGGWEMGMRGGKGEKRKGGR